MQIVSLFFLYKNRLILSLIITKLIYLIEIQKLCTVSFCLKEMN